MLQVEASASCSVRASQAPDQAERPTTEPPAAERARPQPERQAPTQQQARTDDRPFAVQTGAFRYQRSADDLIARLQEAGHQPRIVRVPGSDLLRVRVGRFATPDEARALAGALRDAGFEAIPVRDADDERPS